MDDLLRVLADSRRRQVISCLRRADEGLSLPRLARLVAAREVDVPPEEAPTDVIQRWYLSLYHIHIPKLADVALVRFDEEEGVVREGRAVPEVHNLLDGFQTTMPEAEVVLHDD